VPATRGPMKWQELPSPWAGWHFRGEGEIRAGLG